MPINNTVRVTIKIRNDISTEWSKAANNPILAQGEFGLETDTLLLKVGDGQKTWNQLPYLNKLDNRYLTQTSNGTITFSDDFYQLLDKIVTTEGGQVITGPLQIDYGTDQYNRPNLATNNLDIVNKYYVDRAIAIAGHLSKEIVTTLPTLQEARQKPYTIYMILDTNSSGDDKYKEYMLIGDEIVQIGDTSVDLKNLVTGNTTTGNLISIASDGSLIDSGVAASEVGALEPGTSSTLGGVKSSNSANFIRITDSNDTVGAGFMTLNAVSTSLLYVPPDDSLILDGGNSNGGGVSG